MHLKFHYNMHDNSLDGFAQRVSYTVIFLVLFPGIQFTCAQVDTELSLLDNSGLQYRETLKSTNKYWEITSGGDLIYTDGQQELKKVFAAKPEKQTE